MKRWATFLAVGIISMVPLFAQQAIQVQSGIGFPALLHGGALYYWQDHALGVTVGSLPDEGSTLLCISPTYRYHFGTCGRLGPMPKWYFQASLHYFKDCNDSRVVTDILLSPRIGRDVMVSHNSGISLNLGFSVEAYHHRRYLEPRSTPSWFNTDIHFPILPNAGLSVFYRF